MAFGAVGTTRFCHAKTKTLCTRHHKVAVDYGFRPKKASAALTGHPFTSAAANTATYLWDGANIFAELNESGESKAHYMRGAGLVYQKIGYPVRAYFWNKSAGTLKQVSPCGEKCLYVSTFFFEKRALARQHNTHGDVVQQIDGYGNATPKYRYDAFGCLEKPILAEGEQQPPDLDPNPFRYCGEFWDKDLEEYYLRARSYNPANGRFGCEDALHSFTKPAPDGQEIIEPLSLNLYTYCGNDPVSFVDPLGNAWYHWAIAAIVVAAAAVAVVVTAGGILVAASAVAAVGSGVAAATTASTVAAGAFIGAATVAGGAAMLAGANSKTLKDFGDKGNWGTVAATGFGAALGGTSAYVLDRVSRNSTQSSTGQSKVVTRTQQAAATQQTQKTQQVPSSPKTTAQASLSPQPPSGRGSPNFVVTPGGDVIPVPKGASGPVPQMSKKNPNIVTGFAYTGGRGGTNGQVYAVRIMDPIPTRNSIPAYPGGYVTYGNNASPMQNVSPITGRVLPRNLAHFPINLFWW